MAGNALVGGGVSGIASLLVQMKGEAQHIPEFGTMVLDQEILKLAPDTLTGVLLPPGESSTGGYVTLQYLAYEPGYVTAQGLEGVFIEGTSLEHSHQIPGTWLQDGDRVLLIWSGADTAIVIGVITPRPLEGADADGGTSGGAPAGPPGPAGPAGPSGAAGASGATGPAGPSGAQGPQGPNGTSGPTGPQGPAGLGVNMRGTVANFAALPSSGNTTNDAWVTTDTGFMWIWNGTTWINSGAARGPAGASGPTGATGAQGPQGAPGPTGPMGPAGPQGVQGPVGSVTALAQGTAAAPSLAFYVDPATGIFSASLPGSISLTAGGTEGLRVTAGDLAAPGTLTLGTYERLGELAAAPAPPSTGRLNVYAKTDHKLYFQDSTGLESQLGASLPIAGGTLTGNLLFSPDNTWNIGASGASRPQDLWLGRDAAVGRDVTISRDLHLGTTSESIRYRTGVSPTLNAESADHGVGLYGLQYAGVAVNAYLDGAAWQRWDTAQASLLLWPSPTTWNIYGTAAGSGTISWTSRLALDVAGNLTAAGDIHGRWLYTTDGSNGVVQAATGALYFRSANTNYNFDSGGTISVAGGMTVAGTIATAAINSADWFRVQTANNGIYNSITGYGVGLPVGGATLYPSGDPIVGINTTQTLTSKTINSPTINSPTINTPTVGGHLTMASGYVIGSFINMTASVEPGRPVYVAGNNGDNYMRWWPIAAIGPPGSGATGVVVSASGSQSGTFNGELCRVTLPRTGTYAIVFRGSGSGGGGRCSYSLNSGDSGSFDSGGDSSMDAGIGLHNTGSWGATTVITVNVDCQDNNISGTLYAYFIPTQTYPG